MDRAAAAAAPDTEERQELGLRLRLRLREGPGSRESRCAAWTCLEQAHIASREGGALLLTPHPPP